jgi:hypothetical protein
MRCRAGQHLDLVAGVDIDRHFQGDIEPSE